MTRSSVGSLIIRADAGEDIGTGHVMRCLALAQEWSGRGGAVLFASAALSRALRSRLDREGFAVADLEAVPGGDADADLTVALAQHHDARWIVADGYVFADRYQRRLRDSGHRLIVMDDWGHARHYAADLVVNQNLAADPDLYRSRDPDTRLLLGTDYVLLRREFLSWSGRHRSIPEVAARILVMFGGADVGDATAPVVAALADANLRGVELTIVVGGSVANLDNLRRAVDMFPGKARLEVDVTDMAPILAGADLAISAAGSTCWEMAFMGLPALLLVTADNQRGLATALHHCGAAHSLGEAATLDVEALRHQVEAIASDPERRRAMAAAGQALVDGRGASRVILAMEDEDGRSA